MPRYVLASNGKVLADSALSPPELEEAENHASRPEVRAALAHGRGSATRHSETIDADMMYVALPFGDGGGRAVMRVAMSLAHVDALISHMRWLITGAVLMGLAIAAGMGALASYLASRSLLAGDARAAWPARALRACRGPTRRLGGLACLFNRWPTISPHDEALGDERTGCTPSSDPHRPVLALDSTPQSAREQRGATLPAVAHERTPSST